MGVTPVVVEVLDSDLLVGITGFRFIPQLWWWSVFTRPGLAVGRALVGPSGGTSPPIGNFCLQHLEFCQ